MLLAVMQNIAVFIVSVRFLMLFLWRMNQDVCTWVLISGANRIQR